MIKSNTLFKGPTGLLFNRNLVNSLDGMGTAMSKEFEANTGIAVKCQFVNRDIKGLKLKFHKISKDEAEGKGKEPYKRKFLEFARNYIKKYINYYISQAIKSTIGPSAVVDLKTDTKDGSIGQWMGDTSGKMDKPSSASSSWTGANTR